MSNVELAIKHGAVINAYGFSARPGVAFTAISELDAYTTAVRADAIVEIAVDYRNQLDQLSQRNYNLRFENAELSARLKAASAVLRSQHNQKK